MDAFSSRLMLEALANAKDGERDSLIDMCKEIRKEVGNPDENIIDFVNKNIGRECFILLTDYQGVLHSANKSTSGFYPGKDFPAYVKLTKGECILGSVIGRIFEYSAESVLVRMNNGNLATLEDIKHGHSHDTPTVAKKLASFISSRIGDMFTLTDKDTICEVVGINHADCVNCVSVVMEDGSNKNLRYEDILWENKTLKGA